MASVELHQVSKRFPGGTFAVRDLELEVVDGEFVCLVGPSGCGKSTTLNIIAGLEQPSSGAVQIGGADVTRLSPRERDLAMVFQSYALYPHLDVRGNLAFPLKVARLDRGEIDKRVHQTAALLGLEPLLARRPSELSGGQRQRVALGRALVRRPAAFLFDEPLSNLDANLRAQTRGELKKLHETLGGTFIYVTHDQAEAMTLSDRVVLMNEGAVEQIGTARELYEQPRTLFAARFFGAPTINVCSPRVLGLPDRRPPTSRGVNDTVALVNESSVRVGIRPEHLELRLGQVGPLNGRVYLIEPMGADAWVTVELAGERLVARCEGSLTARVGEHAALSFDPARLLWFDADTGQRIPVG
jgi:multiple sugar transport system ATP-binding protein